MVIENVKKMIASFNNGVGAHDRRLILIVGTLVISTLSIYNLLIPTSVGLIRKSDYTLAKTQSLGFFDNISSRDWELMRKRVRERTNHNDKILGQRSKVLWMEVPNAWYQNNWEPDFSCKHERRIGGLGDGPKWVCDPHRIAKMSNDRKERGGGGCLIYSFGSYGNIRFEQSLQTFFGDKNACEIHVFDSDTSYEDRTLPPNIIHHTWGLESSQEGTSKRNFMSFQETVESLGHRNRVVDVLKIDCEKCEWDTYKDWFDAPITFLQLLVEVHGSPPVANDFFETLQRNNYVTFHKEANTHFAAGRCQEYAFLKLSPDFFS